MKKLAILTLATLSVLLLVKSNTISIEQFITENFTSINNATIVLKEESLSITLNKEITKLEVLENQEKVSCEIFEKNTILCKGLNKSYLPLSFKIYFETEKVIDNEKYQIKILSKMDKFYLITYLPIGFAIKEDKTEIPYLQTFGSDGKRIYAFFSANNTNIFESSFTLTKITEVKIIEPPNSLIIIVLVVAAVIIAIVYLYYKGKIEKQKRAIIEVLDLNERKVLEILMKNNPINQKKIVELTQLSKAEVSKIISSLKQRGIVNIERRGRNNIIYLQKKF